MKKSITLILYSLLFISPLFAQVVNTFTLNSEALNGETIPINIYLPANYNDQSAPYPLYIFLHGCCGLDHQTHIDDFKSRLNIMISNGQIDPMVVVFPSAQGADFGNRHMWLNSVRNGNYGDLVVEDVINYIQDNYNVSTSLIALGGFSMGGDGALRLGLTNSDIFVAQVSHSSYSAVENFSSLIPNIIEEAGQSEAPYNFEPSNGFHTQIIYGISTAWSPNIDNSDNQVDFPLDINGTWIPAVRDQWKSVASPDSIIRQNWGDTKDVPISIYFDSGSQESIFTLHETNNLLNTQLENLVNNENYNIDYKYNIFNESHQLSNSRIDSSLIWLNQKFTEVLTSANTVSFLEGKTEIDIFPNPSSSEINISFYAHDNGIYQVELLDLKGVLLKTNRCVGIGKMNIEFGLSELPAQPLLIVVKNFKTKKIISQKIIKY